MPPQRDKRIKPQEFEGVKKKQTDNPQAAARGTIHDGSQQRTPLTRKRGV
jgi:hypothetical protein